MSGKRSMGVYEKHRYEGDWLTSWPFWKREQQMVSRNPKSPRARKAKRGRR
jgi:hypothetical protein